jgi:hypothetical protein
MTKLMGALAGLALLLCPTDAAYAGIREQGANLYTSTKLWSPLNFNNEWTAFIDPYSVFKVNEKDWDVNITFINSQNQYDPEQTFTYRIDCQNLKFQAQGWRVNGVLKEYKGPLGLWVMNPTRTSIPPGSIMWTAKEYVCGVNNSGSTYYWAYSSFRNGEMKGTIDQIWFKDHLVTISQDDVNLRRVNLMMSVLGGTQANFTELFVKCDKRETMEAANGITSTDWSPISAATGSEVLWEKMCSNRFSYLKYQTSSITMPAPKPAPVPMSVSETNERTRNETGMDEAKRKCGDLGFRAGTPKFGQCVLKLTQ